ncbi:DUF4249 domain-containing protein [Maribacter sp. SA7]|uniref:DUF4249 domain-containing protein n=1 Tax=Maribacter zhoushanensis TaxID=3030012 RepID=UPI0023EB1DD7|nr:DUF4249 domain-containing protein [Maribacter zhoushanensis]MDF4201718.1 DUF4249 domain-containing protein [Maribacter zhoushanensis]
MKKELKWVFIIFTSLQISGCVEEFVPENITEVLDGALVVDARITDENKQQTILLTRTFSFDEIEPTPEIGAQVSILDDLGGAIDFIENEPGNYSTITAINLEQGRAYTLQITTTDNVIYHSNKTTLPSNIELKELKTQRKFNNSENDGISITVSNSNNSSSANYFRYEYEETYKIIPPDYNPFNWDEVDYDFFCEDDDGWEVTVAARNEPADICFGTNKSNSLIITSTSNLTTNDLENFEVRFIGSDNYAISHRYSILVKQYHHDINAAAFFNSLKDFSSSESIFSNVQTGMLASNVSAKNSEDAIVFGYFELSSYSEKRIFFNYEDFYPNEPLPPYIISCDVIREPALYPDGFHSTVIDGKVIVDRGSNSPLIEGIIAGQIAYIGDNENFFEPDDNGELSRAPFLVKPSGCVDCRTFGDNITPEFWIEK